MTIPDDVAASFAETFDGHLAHDIATRLTCAEANVLAELLAALGHPDLAAIWLDAHADGDDQGDDHYRPR